MPRPFNAVSFPLQMFKPGLFSARLKGEPWATVARVEQSVWPLLGLMLWLLRLRRSLLLLLLRTKRLLLLLRAWRLFLLLLRMTRLLLLPATRLLLP